MGKSIASMSRAELIRYIVLQENGQAQAAPERKPKAAPQKWLNVAGYICTSEGTARYSSRVIGRHLRDACGCDAVKGFRCKAVKKYGYDYSTLGKDPKAQLDFASKFSG